MEIFDDSTWQMSWGERAAFEGLLAQRKPDLAIEIGSTGGAALTQLRRHAREIHSFDLLRPPSATDDLGGVTFHTGDSHVLLPALLGSLAAEGRNVDFALVDGDHSPAGMRRDVEDLLDSPAVSNTLIVVHDSTNERVREGLEAIRFAAWPKVAIVELDFLAGFMVREERLRHELWGGFAIVLVDSTRRRYRTGPVTDDRCYGTGELLATAREMVLAREQGEDLSAALETVAAGDTPTRLIAELQAELAEATAEIERLSSVSRHHEALWNSLMDSWSWRITEPVRSAKDRLRGKLPH